MGASMNMRTHTGELEQPNQLYLKEVGSLNMRARQRVYPCVHVYLPARVGPVCPSRCGIRLFYSLTHVLCDITNDVTK